MDGIFPLATNTKENALEALMFIEYLAQMTAALIERELRAEMVKQKVDLLFSLPEGRAGKMHTFKQVHRLFR